MTNIETAIAALRFLARNNGYPSTGGEQNYNAIHLLDIAAHLKDDWLTSVKDGEHRLTAALEEASATLGRAGNSMLILPATASDAADVLEKVVAFIADKADFVTPAPVESVSPDQSRSPVLKAVKALLFVNENGGPAPDANDYSRKHLNRLANSLERYLSVTGSFIEPEKLRVVTNNVVRMLQDAASDTPHQKTAVTSVLATMGAYGLAPFERAELAVKAVVVEVQRENVKRSPPASAYPGAKPIVRVYINQMVEAGKGKSWWVTLVNDIGQRLTPEYHYELDRSLIAANTWAEFLGLEMEPFLVDGVAVEPSIRMESYLDPTDGRHG